jgi:CubicO group peptidase (beta-lactamase class C family)
MLLELFSRLARGWIVLDLDLMKASLVTMTLGMGVCAGASDLDRQMQPSFTTAASQVRSKSSARVKPETLRKIDARVTQFIREHHVPGLAIGIVSNHQVVYSKGYGFASLRSRAPVTPDTVFQLGSESKMMMGIAIMQLRMRGRVDLDKPISAYLPYFRLKDRRYKEITVRQVLSHRSGLPWCPTDDDCETVDYKSPEFDAGALERHVRSLGGVTLRHAPGTTMQYSDLGFEILGDVVAKSSGLDFETYMKRKIFSPLGMQQTSFLLRSIKEEALAAPHVGDENMVVNAYYPYSRQHAPSSHLFSTVRDMSRFALAMLDQGRAATPGVLPEDAFARMWTPEIATNMPSPWEKQLGLGWFLGNTGSHRLVGHAGGDTGFGSDFILAPDDGVAVTVMVNCDQEVEGLTLEVVRRMLAD